MRAWLCERLFGYRANGLKAVWALPETMAEQSRMLAGSQASPGAAFASQTGRKRGAWRLQSRECLEKSIQSMRLLGEEGRAVFFALTGASVRAVAGELAGLRCAACFHPRCKPFQAVCIPAFS